MFVEELAELLNSTFQAGGSVRREPADFCFDGLCMVPGKSWNSQMELEHWNRYLVFQYLVYLPARSPNYD